MKKLPKLLVIALFILVGCYFLFSIVIGKLTYTVGGQRGYSSSVQESKERGVFVKKVNHKIIPNSLKLSSNYVFFIERGFNYGNNGIFVTDSLIGKNQDSPYQLIYGCINPCEKFKPCDYNCNEKKHKRSDTLILLKSSSKFRLELANEFIRDTITYDILYNTLKSYKVDTIGKIKVWDD